ncbi:MAG: GTP-binding protein [Candidatus Omnitrophica bacterium]|nr:GTP-binding protein [Candidatus Omnitrophota bacterium]
MAAEQKMNIVIVGHVDHGKSTLIGRLLADTHSLPKGKLEFVREECRRNSKPFEYAFLLDALKDEQQQGITIDTARIFFKSAKRQYIIIDAPGHIEFLKNMVSGAARAEAALLVIDAQEGIQENSKRHGYLLSMLGIRQVAVCVNKMDLAGYRREVFEKIEKSYSAFLEEIGMKAKSFIPVAAREGENLTGRSARMPWFRGSSVLEVLDSFEMAPTIENKPFRMPVQGVYKFTEMEDTRRIVAGRVESGTISVGDEVVFLPSNKRSVIKSIEGFNRPSQRTVSAGHSTGLTLTEQIYVNRGDIMCKAAEPLPKVSSLMKVELFWMGKRPMVLNRLYKLKIATAQVPVRLKTIERVIDASSLRQASKKEIVRHEVAQCVLHTSAPVAFDLTSELEATGRFVIVDEYDIAGGGIIRQMLDDDHADLRRSIAQREQKWDFSIVEPEERVKSYGHRAALVLLTGPVGMDKRTIAKELEKILFSQGAKTYFLGMGNLLRGLNSDVELHRLERHEHVRRMGEVAHLFMDAGLIVVATASGVNDAELEELQEVTARGTVLIVNVGKNNFKRAVIDLDLDPKLPAGKNAEKVFQLLSERKILFAR